MSETPNKAPLTRLRHGQEPRHDGRKGKIGGCDIDRRAAAPDRRAARLAGDPHDAGIGLHHGIVAGSRRARALAPIAGDGDPHQARMAGLHVLIAEPHPLQRAGAVVLHHHIGRIEKLEEHLAVRIVLEVERNRALSPVAADEIDALALDEGRPAPHLVTARRLDLDHVSAHFRRQHGRDRPGDVSRQVEDSNPFEQREPWGLALKRHAPALPCRCLLLVLFAVCRLLIE